MNPFDETKDLFSVLINSEGQHSLWPQANDIPNGWTKVFGPANRQASLDFIETNWTDMRPNSLIGKMTS
jgi:MbtH protein